MRYKRVEPGLYRSLDGRVEIARETSQQTRRPDETCWSVVVDGKLLPRDADTLAEAKAMAARRLAGG